MLDAAGGTHGFDVARMFLPRSPWPARFQDGRARSAGQNLRRRHGCCDPPYAISIHVVHGLKLGRDLRISHAQPALLAFGSPATSHGIFCQCMCMGWRISLSRAWPT